MTIYLSLLVCIIGLVVFLFATGKAEKAGNQAYWIGLLVFLLQFGGPAVSLR